MPNKTPFSDHALTLMHLSRSELNVMLEHAEALALAWKQVPPPTDPDVLKGHTAIQAELDGMVRLITEANLAYEFKRFYRLVGEMKQRAGLAREEREQPVNEQHALTPK